MTDRQTIGLLSLLCLTFLGCGVTAFVENPASVAGLSYWAAATGTPVPTETRYLGHSTPVFADTPVPNVLTEVPFITTITTTPFAPPAWVTTTPVYITETPQPPETTTPSLPMIGFTTPMPLETPYYRVGSFYMNSDVYVGGTNNLVFRIVLHSRQNSPHAADAAYHYLTVQISNLSADEQRVIASDLFFIREVHQEDGLLTGRWTPQNEPLLARGLPSYETQQLTAIAPDETREIVLGFVVPKGEVEQVGLMTDWQRPVEGGLPIWFYLQNDPLGPFADAVNPPPPTSVFLDAGGTTGGGTTIGGGSGGWGRGLWPTTGTVTRGFGCEPFYTGVNGAGFGCPADKPWFHNGVDIANGTGTAIWSPVEGALVYAGPNPTGPDCRHIAGSQAPHAGLGNYQKIRGSNTLHYFGHLNSHVLTEGVVSAEQTTSEMGSTGCSTGSHLHWIVYHNGSLIDPASWAGEGP